jgi:hypothetical protein
MKGEEVGIIAWESKDAKLWSDAWAEKLKEDRLRVGASISVIVTTVLPQGMKHFGVYKGVWVTAWQYAIPLTVALREKLLESHTLKGSLVAKDEKMEVLYSYLTSPDFRDKIQNIVEAFQVLKDELEKEKRAMERLWAQREKQLERVMKNTAGMYGDMQ